MDIAEQWGLPPGFTPVRYAITEEVKQALRRALRPGEPVIVSMSNEADTVAIVATPYRLFTVKTSGLGGGFAAATIREYPWEGVFDIAVTPVTHSLKFAIHFRSSDGRTVEVGAQAETAKEQVETLSAFEKTGGQNVLRALLQIRNFKWEQASGL